MVADPPNPTTAIDNIKDRGSRTSASRCVVPSLTVGTDRAARQREGTPALECSARGDSTEVKP